jgi:hypothetical protein
MRPLRNACLIALGLALSGCANTNMAEFTQHLNDRNCATRGSVTGSAGLLGTNLGGHVEWDCGKDPAP